MIKAAFFDIDGTLVSLKTKVYPKSLPRTIAALRQKGILVRHFDKPKLTDYLRITIGSREQMAALVCALTEILEESL